MAIRNIKRWQWLLASLVIGLALGYFQHLPTENWQKAFGDTITQQQFEEGLTREQSGLRWFRNVVIYPERVEVAGKTVPVTIVTGDYFNGKLESQNGQRVAIWRPRCYIAEGPFQPITPNPNIKASDTVLAYLKSLKGVSHTYAWWRDSTSAIGLWTAGSFLVIGLIWPTVINLIVFGSIMRPKEERGIDLSKVSAQTPQSESQAADTDLTAVAKMGEQLEAKLAAEAGPRMPNPQPPADAPPVRQLTATSLEAPLTGQPHEQKDFGQDRDDFYPTERHKSHPETEQT
jgi:hypothetical protein